MRIAATVAIVVLVASCGSTPRSGTHEPGPASPESGTVEPDQPDDGVALDPSAPVPEDPADVEEAGTQQGDAVADGGEPPIVEGTVTYRKGFEIEVSLDLESSIPAFDARGKLYVYVEPKKSGKGDAGWVEAALVQVQNSGVGGIGAVVDADGNVIEQSKVTSKTVHLTILGDGKKETGPKSPIKKGALVKFVQD